MERNQHLPGVFVTIVVEATTWLHVRLLVRCFVKTALTFSIRARQILDFVVRRVLVIFFVFRGQLAERVVFGVLQCSHEIRAGRDLDLVDIELDAFRNDHIGVVGLELLECRRWKLCVCYGSVGA